MLGFLSKLLPAGANSQRDIGDAQPAASTSAAPIALDEIESQASEASDGLENLESASAAQAQADAMDVDDDTNLPGNGRVAGDGAARPVVYEYISDDDLLLTSSGSSVQGAGDRSAATDQPARSRMSSDSGAESDDVRNIASMSRISQNVRTVPNSHSPKKSAGMAARKSTPMAAPAPVRSAPLSVSRPLGRGDTRVGQSSQSSKPSLAQSQRPSGSGSGKAEPGARSLQKSVAPSTANRVPPSMSGAQSNGFAMPQNDRESSEELPDLSAARSIPTGRSTTAGKPVNQTLAKKTLAETRRQVIELISSSDDSEDELAGPARGTEPAFSAHPRAMLPGRPPLAMSSGIRQSNGAVPGQAIAGPSGFGQPAKAKRPREPSVELEVPARVSPTKKAKTSANTAASSRLPSAAASTAPQKSADGRTKGPPNSLKDLPDAVGSAKPSPPYWHIVWAVIQTHAKDGNVHADAPKATEPSLIGGIAVDQILRAICYRYPYYLPSFADGSLERSILSTLQTRKCFRYYKLGDGTNLWYIDTSVDLAPPKKAPKNGAEGAPSVPTAIPAGPSKRINPPAPALAPKAPVPGPAVSQRVLLPEQRPFPLAEAAEQTFATSLSHLPDIPPAQTVPYETVTLARAAILGSPFRRLKIDEIGQQIVAKYPQIVPPEWKTRYPDNWLLNWSRGPLGKVLARYMCFYSTALGAKGGHYWLVDLQVDPRMRNFKCYKKSELAKYYGGSDLADTAKTDLDALEFYLGKMKSFYVDKEARYRRREVQLGAMQPRYAMVPSISRPSGSALMPQQQTLQQSKSMYAPILANPQPRLPSFVRERPADQPLAVGTSKPAAIGFWPSEYVLPAVGNSRLPYAPPAVGTSKFAYPAYPTGQPEPTRSVGQPALKRPPVGELQKQNGQLDMSAWNQPASSAQPKPSDQSKSSAQLARSGSPELAEILPSPKKNSRPVSTISIEVPSSRLSSGSRKDKTASAASSLPRSEPSSLESSAAERAVGKGHSTDGLSTPIELDSSRNNSAEAIRIPQFFCGRTDRHHPQPCNKVFFTSEERDHHLRYVHAQKSSAYDWKAQMVAQANAKVQEEMEAAAMQAKQKKLEVRSKAKSIKIKGAATAPTDHTAPPSAGPSNWV